MQPRIDFYTASPDAFKAMLALENAVSLSAEFSPAEMVDLTMAISTINSWNRLAVGFRKFPQE